MTWSVENYLKEWHSNDTTGELGEGWPAAVMLINDYTEWQKSAPTKSYQKKVSRVKGVTTQQTVCEGHSPLGRNSQAEPLSQIAAENYLSAR